MDMLFLRMKRKINTINNYNNRSKFIEKFELKKNIYTHVINIIFALSKNFFYIFPFFICIVSSDYFL